MVRVLIALVACTFDFREGSYTKWAAEDQVGSCWVGRVLDSHPGLADATYVDPVWPVWIRASDRGFDMYLGTNSECSWSPVERCPAVPCQLDGRDFECALETDTEEFGVVEYHAFGSWSDQETFWLAARYTESERPEESAACDTGTVVPVARAACSEVAIGSARYYGD
jgi:hypothetical protein